MRDLLSVVMGASLMTQWRLCIGALDEVQLATGSMCRNVLKDRKASCSHRPPDLFLHLQSGSLRPVCSCARLTSTDPGH